MHGQIKTKITSASKGHVGIERYSDDFNVRISIDLTKKPESSKTQKTGFAFVDAFLERLSDHSSFSVSAEITKQIAEESHLLNNLGYAFGEGLRKLYDKRKANETSVTIRSGDNNQTMCMFAINAKKQPGEANLQIIGKPAFNADHFFAFFDGFAQGMESEVNAVIKLSDEKKTAKKCINHVELISMTFADSLKRLLRKEQV